ncbi:PREDICTED: F-box protein At5g39450-like [Lupinus angustifolius]|nr:PREDICTED: F-box protein At5g39450-like [Lupinus angustifolius]XP_019432086.1 PREDICTED: F-box protein At5g39450-like [Lupinus angustifolius]XP_019432087.1 PREDICTED: F-box protein At5g39450-like [Lupinus angustifolius]XP_019432088.1 PREDICTED: F-box protein At5g39450-like [Lupinus angustifolius]XP_019432089.1 PREDICTED: F-box protein At5g39450-like [Lupinus angustifolius]
MLHEHCDSSLILSLPDDVFAIIVRFLLPRDVCNLGMCCRNLNALVASEKIWLTQCGLLGILPHKNLVEWRKGVSSYKALCRFLASVQPLIGIWVHQNPELGNVVYVMPGFISVVGCRIIPQELSPLGIEDSPILWASVFEVIGDFNGSATFLLHGREKGIDYIYPALVKSIEKSCNLLLLEVEPGLQTNLGTSLQIRTFGHCSGVELSRKVCRSNNDISRSQRVNNEAMVPFSKLAYTDRRKLLEVTTSHIRQKVPDTVAEPLFPRLRDDKDNFKNDLVILWERRSLLSEMFNLGCSQTDCKASSQQEVSSKQLEVDNIRKSLNCSRPICNSLPEEGGCTQCIKRKSLGGYFWNRLKQILGRSNLMNVSHSNSKKLTSSSEIRHAQLQEFLKSSDTIRLTLKAPTVKLSSYRAWPNMHDNRFALYKLPLRVPREDQEYAGLWGGTFGWPPGKLSEDKPEKALFFLLLSYEESQGQQLLIATKILEGTHYVLHPNGSAMFIANINEFSSEPFPWDTDADSNPVDIKEAFIGEGIATGYGFRYPGSKPGSLFIFQNGGIAFIWKESRAILTLKRLNLQELLKKGERIPSLPPIANFSYLTKSYSNVFTAFPSPSNSLSSPR